jgi:hypothetical protein
MPKTIEDDVVDEKYAQHICESARKDILELDPSKPGLDKSASMASLELRLNELYHYAIHFPDSEYMISQWKGVHDFAKEHLPEGLYQIIYKK